MGCAGEREKIEDKMMLMKLERMEVQMEKEKELKKLSELEGHTIKRQHIPDYIDPAFAREKQIYDDDDEEIGDKKTDDARKKDKNDKKDKDDKKIKKIKRIKIKIVKRIKIKKKKRIKKKIKKKKKKKKIKRIKRIKKIKKVKRMMIKRKRKKNKMFEYEDILL